MKRIHHLLAFLAFLLVYGPTSASGTSLIVVSIPGDGSKHGPYTINGRPGELSDVEVFLGKAIQSTGVKNPPLLVVLGEGATIRHFTALLKQFNRLGISGFSIRSEEDVYIIKDFQSTSS